MRRQNTESIGSVIRQFLQEQQLETPLMERKVGDCWENVVGKTVLVYTQRIEAKAGVVYVRITNAALRQELFIQRQQIIERMNQHAGYAVFRDIRFT